MNDINNDVLEFQNLYKELKEKYDKEKYIYFLSLYEDIVFFIGEKDTKMLDKYSKSFFEIFFHLNKKELAKSIESLKIIKQFLLQKKLEYTKTYEITYEILNFFIKIS